MRAVIYARYSSHHQREESIEGQIRECRAYAKYHNYNIVELYTDRALSGTTDARPDFQRMIQDASKKHFDFILVYSLDRFARKRADSIIYKAKLKSYGVKVISVKENITDEPAGILMESVLEGLAEYYSVELGQKIKRGMTENALAAKWTSGHVPFGYKVNSVDKKLVLDPENSIFVKKCFEMYIAGEKIVNIAKMLNEAKCTTSLGKQFGRNSFHRMFSNEAYIGVFKWMDIRIPNAIPPIITREVFKMAQERVERSKQKTDKSQVARKSENYPLSGKLFCGNCGAAMVGVSGKTKYNRYHYYDCQTRRRHKTCDNLPVSCTVLENAIITKTKEVLKSKDILNEITSQLLEYSKKKQNKNKLAQLEAELKLVTKKIDRMVNIAIESGELPIPLKEKMIVLSDKQKDLEEDIRIEKDNLEHCKIKQSDIELFFNIILNDENHGEKIINALVHKVIVKKEKDGNFAIQIFYNYSPDYAIEQPLGSDANEKFLKCTSWWTSGVILRTHRYS